MCDDPSCSAKERSSLFGLFRTDVSHLHLTTSTIRSIPRNDVNYCAFWSSWPRVRILKNSCDFELRLDGSLWPSEIYSVKRSRSLAFARLI